MKCLGMVKVAKVQNPDPLKERESYSANTGGHVPQDIEDIA